MREKLQIGCEFFEGGLTPVFGTTRLNYQTVYKLVIFSNSNMTLTHCCIGINKLNLLHCE